jgi:hypothetical protein
VRKKQVTIPDGSIAWRQGAPFGKDQIKYIPPPYDQLKPISLIGVELVGWVDKGRTPSETIQVIGDDTNVPEEITIDLGVTDIRISDFARKIEFTGKGLLTDVGQRITGTTTGMSVPAVLLRREEQVMRQEIGEPSLKVVKKKQPKHYSEGTAQEQLSRIL